MKRLSFIILLAVVATSIKAQVTMNCELGLPPVYGANCWQLQGFTWVSNQNNPITGSSSARTNQMNSIDPQNCYIKTPWMKPGSGNITFKGKFDNTTGTSRSLLFFYIPYNAGQTSGEGTPVQFHTHSFPAPFSTAVQNFSVAIPAAIANSNSNYKIQISMIGLGNNARLITDDYVFPGTYNSDPLQDCIPVPDPVADADGDGVLDGSDQFPNDPHRAFVNYFPSSTNPGTLAFEDLWPAKGDYDFNDLVIDYILSTVINAQNQVVEVLGSFTMRASGAGFHNGFGFQLEGISPNKVISVSGNAISPGSIYTLMSNGLEAGQTHATCIVFDDFFNHMTWSGGGLGVNTDPAGPAVSPVTLNVLLTLIDGNGQPAPGGAVSNLDLLPSTFNFFLVADQNRGREVHLPDRNPTDLANLSLFGTLDDDSDPSQGKYYKTDNNLPWAINVLQGFDYPVEKAKINEAYPHFIEWAASSGTSFEDWYTPQTGYRILNLIY